MSLYFITWHELKKHAHHLKDYATHCARLTHQGKKVARNCKLQSLKHSILIKILIIKHQ